MKYLIALWFFVRVVFIGVLLSPLFLLAFIMLIFSRTAFLGVLKSTDDIIASVMFLTWERTLSGIAGEGQAKKAVGYTLVANIIDWLAILVGDDLRHCRRAYLWELKQGYVK